MHKLKCLLFILSLASIEIVLAETDSISGAVDQNMAAQRAACDKNTAMEWSTKLSRCIGKQAAVDTRNEVKSCDAYTDAAAKQNCQMKIAEKNTGLSSNTANLHQPKTTGSMIMNSAASVYGAVYALDLFHKKGREKENSNCMSKKIYGITGAAGLASDFYLRSKAKKDIQALEGKFMVDKNNTAYEAQLKALEYLKEEQKTVMEIANLEKKRNMMLVAGYGLAAAWGAYEMLPMGANPNCIPEVGNAKVNEKSKTLKEEVPVDMPASTPPKGTTRT